MVASYFAQGDFKETMQALYVLAFALSLRELTADATRRALPLRFVPAALLAIGSVYTYSFPGLAWLAATAAIWATVEFAWSRSKTATPAGGAAARFGPSPLRAALLALLTFVVLVAPEIGRMLDFRRFETFAPNGPGLGNLFGQISPFEALGIWPSGDFRLAPGAGAMPAFGYYLGAAFAAILLVYGLALCWRRRETAVISGLLACALAYAAARIGGTPYTAAKAIEIAAPLAAVTILLPLLRRPVAALYVLAAGACSLLALANAPIGPASYTPALDRTAAAGHLRVDRRPGAPRTARRTSMATPTSPGSCAADGSASRPTPKRAGLRRRGCVSSSPRLAAQPPSRACAFAAL